MNLTGTPDILLQRPPSSAWIRKSWCWALYIPQSWQSQACCLGSDCQLKNLFVIGPQNIGRLPVVKALTVNVHLISREFIHTEIVCCYLQPKPKSQSEPPGWAMVEVEVIASILWSIIETNYLVLKLEQIQRDMLHSTQHGQMATFFERDFLVLYVIWFYSQGSESYIFWLCSEVAPHDVCPIALYSESRELTVSGHAGKMIKMCRVGRHIVQGKNKYTLPVSGYENAIVKDNNWWAAKTF